ncbi:MAG: sugar-binding domain-containing protein, partial [Gemmatimonadales bacterium]
MDPGWRFTLGDTLGAERPAFNDRAWRQLDLPHDWSIEGTMQREAPGGGRMGFYPGGIGWYRKAFRLPAGSAGRRAFLEFDGVYMNSDVWINGALLGRRPYGYISFAYEITQHLVSGVNVVAVRVDNSAQPNSRWYSGSGIYRHVWLTLSDPLHVGQWGTTVTTPRVDSASADVVIATRVLNQGTTARRGTLRSIILDATGREIARTESALAVEAGQGTDAEQRVQVSAPRMWSVESPYLYALRTEIVDGARVADVFTTPFGIRSIAFDANRGFLLNG